MTSVHEWLEGLRSTIKWPADIEISQPALNNLEVSELG